MTATLTFDLNDHDERQAHMRCVKALDMALVLWGIDNRMRSSTDEIISRIPVHSQSAIREGVEIAIAHVRELMADHNINLEDLIS